ncbi:DUF3306 domain-containing protein [Vibrio alginolyticus]|uniref:DUF3306 domain-containing protein n=1 Tax=Vibrio TaxID=662 RepID=UPI001E3307C0|nr:MULTISPECIES: DUF3306 domain-containing protein [Vibrio]EGQ9761301.1 DUF3306 domain-containing protein [Vibrio alginolyticus]ELA9201763.1 DUF3306 domain-containing protein [Vibrio alginolyticus]ELB2769478.1 DUF3306 domain-containing protein [Vibrio alginolyticus]MCC9652357.1 DUF3306 domain-containing protein [Vibrio sp. MA64]MCR9439414.1 DUF3306 domain-containing protein [Vibrio alginolyticus]
MATSFLSRWSKRKLEESSQYDEEITPIAETEQSTENVTALSNADESSDALNVNEDSQAPDITASVEVEKTEEMSVAQLLVSEASESVKKAALRKMFLSEEFNVRDGLDDYDDDYSNLKSLSQDVAETLRDWVKDKVEDEPNAETAQGSELNANDIASGVVEDAESNTDKSGQITQDENELYINTVPGESDTFAEESQPNEVRQNIPHKE